GVVVGGIAGAATSIFTSGAVDSLYDSGADSLADWGKALQAGGRDIGETVSNLAGGAKDVFNEIF
ncbi:hypothetical protein NO275_08390, partial [Campylobacter jejuni]|uniref:hypothetical protein n=1 Tax=Campylobacter jejuni TaxID=197 RepID=UPI0027E13FF3